ncbi:Ff.00g011450.m01.CDS01 [Fusarium sp. VM40]|nr:Ff.00g011450.m01.CDS01 [Fusarium sp. VM40]
MEVGNKNNDASFDLKDDDCLAEFVKIVNGCPYKSNGADGSDKPDHSRGARTDVAGWHFRIDPNNGLGC